MRTAMGCRARATRCCRALLFVAAAAAAWGCIIPARTATTLSIFVAPISINMAGRAVRRCAPWASMRRSKRLLLEGLTPDRLALAIAALGELENEARALERQWSLKRERARYEAERARRQYDAVEPENRLVARSLERVWEDKLRQAEQIDIEYEIWRRQQPISLAAADRAQIISLGKDLPKLWDAASVVERKQILRLVVKEVVLDQRPESGQVWIRTIWQTGAVSAQGPAQCEQLPQLRRRRAS